MTIFLSFSLSLLLRLQKIRNLIAGSGFEFLAFKTGSDYLTHRPSYPIDSADSAVGIDKSIDYFKTLIRHPVAGWGEEGGWLQHFAEFELISI